MQSTYIYQLIRVYKDGASSTSIAKGAVIVPYRLITFPSTSMRNFVKFHLMRLPNRVFLVDALRNLNTGAAFCPFTHTWWPNFLAQKCEFFSQL